MKPTQIKNLESELGVNTSLLEDMLHAHNVQTFHYHGLNLANLYEREKDKTMLNHGLTHKQYDALYRKLHNYLENEKRNS